MAETLMKSENSLVLNSELLVKAVIKLMKQDISQRYKVTGEVTDEDWEFCDKIDWHPTDELEYKEEFIKRISQAEKGKFKTSTELEFWKK